MMLGIYQGSFSSSSSSSICMSNCSSIIGFKRLSFLYWIAFVNFQKAINLKYAGLFLASLFCSIRLCVFAFNTTTLLIIVALTCLKIKWHKASTFSFLIIIFSSPLHCHTNFKIRLSISTKKKRLLVFWLGFYLIYINQSEENWHFNSIVFWFMIIVFLFFYLNL